MTARTVESRGFCRCGTGGDGKNVSHGAGGHSAWRSVAGSVGVLLLCYATFVHATTSLVEQQYVGSMDEGLAACTAMVSIPKTCGSNGEMLGTGCVGCGKPGTAPDTEYCQATENLWVASVPNGNCTSLMQSITIAFIYKQSACGAGLEFVGPSATDCVPATAVQVARDANKHNGDDRQPRGTCVGNPCELGSGNKFQVETDFVGGEGIPSFVRTYTSSQWNDPSGLGIGWQHNHGQYLEIKAGRVINAHRGDGRVTTYTKIGALWTADADVKAALTQDASGYSLALPDGTVERYALVGKLSARTTPAGQVTTYGYTGNLLTSITGPYGHKRTLVWLNGKLRKLTLPDGQSVLYTVSAVTDNLTSVAYPDNRSRQYVYEAPTFSHALSGIVDESGTRLSTYAYDQATGQAILTEHAGGMGHYDLAYSGATTTFTDAAGIVRTATFTRILDINRLTSLTN